MTAINTYFNDLVDEYSYVFKFYYHLNALLGALDTKDEKK